MPDVSTPSMIAGDPAACVRVARAAIAEVIGLLKAPTADNAERCLELLAEVEQMLRSAGDMLRANSSQPGCGFAPSAGAHRELEQLRREVKTLASCLSESDRLVSGWIRSAGVKNGGYTAQGASAPLILVKKVDVTG
jgi:hypothetical protein